LVIALRCRSLEHFLVHVAEEGKLDVNLLGESGVCCGGIHTDAKNGRIIRIDLTGSESSLDRLKLLGSTTGEGEDVNGEKDILLAVEVESLTVFHWSLRRVKSGA